MTDRERWNRIRLAAEVVFNNFQDEEIDLVIRKIRKLQRVWRKDWNCWFELPTKTLRRAYEAGQIHKEMGHDNP